MAEALSISNLSDRLKDGDPLISLQVHKGVMPGISVDGHGTIHDLADDLPSEIFDTTCVAGVYDASAGIKVNEAGNAIAFTKRGWVIIQNNTELRSQVRARTFDPIIIPDSSPHSLLLRNAVTYPAESFLAAHDLEAFSDMGKPQRTRYIFCGRAVVEQLFTDLRDIGSSVAERLFHVACLGINYASRKVPN